MADIKMRSDACVKTESEVKVREGAGRGVKRGLKIRTVLFGVRIILCLVLLFTVGLLNDINSDYLHRIMMLLK